MKKIISGNIQYLEIKDIQWVTVPLYDELTPSKVLEALEINASSKENEEMWNLIIELCPEIEEKGYPKDRDFFFNCLNTLQPNCIDKIVRNAILNRE